MNQFYLFIILLSMVISCGNQPPREIIVEKEVLVPTEIPNQNPPPLQESKPGFFKVDAWEQAMIEDIQRINQQDALQTRYLVACNFYNQGKSEQDMRRILSGANKAVNGISLAIQPFTVDPINGVDCIYRLELDRFKKTKEDWRLIERNANIPVISNTVRGQTLRFLTGTNTPWLFASDFAATITPIDNAADDCGIYCVLLRQPDDFEEFMEQQGIDFERSIRLRDAVFAGISDSQIALQKDRLIMGLKTDFGFCWITFDASLLDDDNLFANPFIDFLEFIDGIRRTDKIFDAKASETICQLPNGLLMNYRLAGYSNGKFGAPAFSAPPDIVANIDSPDIVPQVEINLCQKCHKGGIIYVQDDVTNQVQFNPAFNSDEKKIVDNFFRSEIFEPYLNQSNQLHNQTLRELDVEDGTDPVNEQLIFPLRRKMSAAQVAAYTGLTTDIFLEKLRGTSRSSVEFGNLFEENGQVSFNVLKQNFRTLIDELRVYQDDLDF